MHGIVMTESHHHRLIYRMTMNQVSGKQTIWFVTCVEKKKKKQKPEPSFSGCASIVETILLFL